MSELRQRRAPIRSQAILRAAKGEECTLQIFSVCVGGTETTVSCHIHDETFGRSEKADDCSIVFGCRGCHDEIDRRTRKLDPEKLEIYIRRGLQRTTRRLIELGVYPVKLDVAKPFIERATRPKAARKPSRPIPQRPRVKRVPERSRATGGKRIER